MKRRGFLGSLFGLAAVPVAAKVPAAAFAPAIPPLTAFTPGPLLLDAERMCNPPIIVENGDFMRLYREEFIAAFESKQTLLRDSVVGRK